MPDHVIDFMRKRIAGEPEPLRCPGIGRDAENDKAIMLYFSRKLTDDEMRFLHEVVQRAAPSMPRAASR